MKQTIRLNERELHNLISESVKRVMNEAEGGLKSRFSTSDGKKNGFDDAEHDAANRIIHEFATNYGGSEIFDAVNEKFGEKGVNMLWTWMSRIVYETMTDFLYRFPTDKETEIHNRFPDGY